MSGACVQLIEIALIVVEIYVLTPHWDLIGLKLRKLQEAVGFLSPSSTNCVMSLLMPDASSEVFVVVVIYQGSVTWLFSVSCCNFQTVVLFTLYP